VVNPISRRQRRHDVRSARPAVERLEERALLTAGSLDPTFGLDGRVVTGLVGSSNDTADATVVQSDGKVVAAGWTGASSALNSRSRGTTPTARST